MSMEPSCILFQNEDKTITLIDAPRSIESAQGDCGGRRLISSKPLEHPYPSVEPKSTKAIANISKPSIRDLLLQRHLELALNEIRKFHKGSWCLPRVTVDSRVPVHESKRQRLTNLEDEEGSKGHRATEFKDEPMKLGDSFGNEVVYHRNSKPTPITCATVGPERTIVWVPPKSTILLGDINTTRNIFSSCAPKFDLIVLDPPWPNRSARRKHSYNISYGLSDIRLLLSSIPINDHLANGGMVCVWVTNKPALHDMLLDEGEIFEEWGIQLVEEWIWIKVTTSGEPICDLDSTWRKPYEVLLLGRNGRQEGSTTSSENVRRRVIVAVPDLHSRKPNLKTMLEPYLPLKYEALEVFSRNITAGWWAWGNEVVKFQTYEHWTSD